MIELKHISKTYKSKKSHNTKAIDDVSLTFEQRGMTFILGKSGSGKSTLLNVLGGLDRYDTGDMIVLGKSTKNFKKKDYDSYRNTYIGFVFQEFNILEDYNVYENIILALELQQKKVEEQKVEELLKKLELNDLRTRKVNELSGGQKQRVAIARALIKDPKIILADESTGNLDSKTSKQVMDLLKEISKEKLVVVVSHDVESANNYADRIIEIHDGKVARDTKEETSDQNNHDSYQCIRSKLPWNKSFKLGIGSLKHKKIKLFFTILLTVFSLLFLSVSDTLSNYEVEKAHAKLLKEQKVPSVQIQKYKLYDEEWMGRDLLYLNDDDIKKIQKEYPDATPVYQIRQEFGTYNYNDLLQITQVDDYNDQYYTTSNTILAEVVEFDNIDDVLEEKIIGKVPTENNEILISNYFADVIMKNGIQVEDKTNKLFNKKTYYPKSYEDLLNSNYEFSFGTKQKVKIVGIIDYDLKQFQDLKNQKKLSTREMNNLASELDRNARYRYNQIYVKKGFMDNLNVEEYHNLSDYNNYSLSSKEINIHSDGYYVSPAVLEKEVEYFDGTSWKKTNHLNKDEMILNITQLNTFQMEQYQKQLDELIEKNPTQDVEELEKLFFEHYFNANEVIGKTITLNVYEGRSFDLDKPDQFYRNLKVIGVTPYKESETPNNYFAEELVGQYKTQTKEIKGLMVKDGKEEGFIDLLNRFPHDESITATSSYSDVVIGMVGMINTLKEIAFYASLVFFVFAIFLISNFIFTSIHYRKKEIGILRALGARTFDVIKIFLWEGFVLAIISGTVASIFLVIITNILNNFIMSNTGLILTPFMIGIRQFALIYVVVLVVTLISSVLPIIKISRMKPIDAILNK